MFVYHCFLTVRLLFYYYYLNLSLFVLVFSYLKKNGSHSFFQEFLSRLTISIFILQVYLFSKVVRGPFGDPVIEQASDWLAHYDVIMTS